jgi:hypothetical protein
MSLDDDVRARYPCSGPITWFTHCARVHSVHSQMEDFAKVSAGFCKFKTLINHVRIIYEI